jgi:hypothetical protein
MLKNVKKNLFKGGEGGAHTEDDWVGWEDGEVWMQFLEDPLTL